MTVEHELALRLAWYVRKYGSIPHNEMIRLFRIANGLATADGDLELGALAQETVAYFQSLAPEDEFTSNRSPMV